MITSRLLVAGQMTLIVLLASPVTQLYSGTVLSLIGVLFIASSLALVLWAFVSMRAGTFTVMPEPTSGASLTQVGPYGYVRHPMYSAVIVGGIGATLSHADLKSCLLLVALIALLVVKLLREERYLSTRYPDYEEYKTRTSALLPLVY